MEVKNFNHPRLQHPNANPISRARLAAEVRHLDHLFDAYQTFCLHGSNELSWRDLVNFLKLALQVQPLTHVSTAVQLRHVVEQDFVSYLHGLKSEHLGYLINDLVTAYFHHAEVLQPADHIRTTQGTASLEVVTWVGERSEDLLCVLRTQLQQLLQTKLQVMIEAIIAVVSSRSDDWRSYRPSEFWTPCSHSHYPLLLHLDLEIDPPLVQIVEQTLGCARDSPTQRWKFLPRPLPEAKRTSFLSRRAGKAQTTVPILDPIQENDRDSADVQSLLVTHDTDAQWLALRNSNESKRGSKRSSFSDLRSFVTALTHGSGSVRKSVLTLQSQYSIMSKSTAGRASSIQSFISWPTDNHISNIMGSTAWAETLRQRDIIPDPELDNWSDGRGQHAEYATDERDLIPLYSEHLLGEGSTAVVDSVCCKRVRLVRKVIKCNRRTRISREDAVREVQQLYKAQHAHIVRLVGTYVIDDELAILTYPRAEWNLEQFLTRPPTIFIEEERRDALRRFFRCLANVLDFIHSFPIKHMDIKPQNILVRDVRSSSLNRHDAFNVYLADFGSSSLYPSVEDSETDNLTPFTRTYAAKEVVLQDTRGLKADIFSMGCVFAEMLATALDFSEDSSPRSALLQARSGTSGSHKPYYLRLDDVRKWMMGLTIEEPYVDLIAARFWAVSMLSDAPGLRPSAREIAEDPRLLRSCFSCDRAVPEAFEKATGT